MNSNFNLYTSLLTGIIKIIVNDNFEPFNEVYIKTKPIRTSKRKHIDREKETTWKLNCFI